MVCYKDHGSRSLHIGDEVMPRVAGRLIFPLQKMQSLSEYMEHC